MPTSLESLVHKLETKVKQLREVQTELEQRLELATLDRELAEERARNYEVEAAKVPQLEELVEIGKQIEQSYANKEQEILAKLHEAQASGAVQRLQRDLTLTQLRARSLELELRKERVGITQTLWEEGVHTPWALYAAEVGKADLTDIWQQYANGTMGVSQVVTSLNRVENTTLQRDPVKPALCLLSRLYEPKELPKKFHLALNYEVQCPFELLEKAIYEPTIENVTILADKLVVYRDCQSEQPGGRDMSSPSKERIRYLEVKLERAKKLTGNFVQVQAECRELSRSLRVAENDLARKKLEVEHLQESFNAADDIDALQSALNYLLKSRDTEKLSPLSIGPRPVYSRLAGLTVIANLRRYVKDARLVEFSMRRRSLEQNPGWIAAQQWATLSTINHP